MTWHAVLERKLTPVCRVKTMMAMSGIVLILMTYHVVSNLIRLLSPGASVPFGMVRTSLALFPSSHPNLL